MRQQQMLALRCSGRSYSGLRMVELDTASQSPLGQKPELARDELIYLWDDLALIELVHDMEGVTSLGANSIFPAPRLLLRVEQQETSQAITWSKQACWKILCGV